MPLVVKFSDVYQRLGAQNPCFCVSGGYLNHHYQIVGVQSCQDVLLLYRAMWILVVLNLVAFGLGVFTTAILGGVIFPILGI